MGGSKDPLRHKVRLTKGFWMGQYTVTQGEWMKLMRNGASRAQGSLYLPVDWVSWEDAVKFCDQLNVLEQRAGHVPVGYRYRLSTDAEWEYACRAGSDGDFGGANEDFWCADNSGGRPHEVGEMAPNPWGLYDMRGNVWQWCLDRWYDYPQAGPDVTVNPITTGKPESDSFCLRGGAWYYGRGWCSIPMRERSPSIAGGYRGFRVVLGSGR